jgi:DNA repair exonuclease SbcCD ATPase subunit
MLTRVKDTRKEVRDNIKSIEDELRAINESILSTSRKISELEKISEDENKERIIALKDDLILLTEDKRKLDDACSKLIQLENEIDSRIEHKNSEYNKNSEILNNAKRKLKLYENKKCPTCESDLDTGFHVHVKKQNEDIIVATPSIINQLQEDINNLKSEFSTNRKKQNAVITKISDLNSRVNSIKSDLVKLSKGMDPGGQFTQLTSLVDEFKIRHTEKGSAKLVKYEEEQFMSLMEMILGDDGVKNLAVKTILPGLNTTIAQMVSQMHLSFHIRFDDKFNCLINHLGEDVNPRTLSTGERKKADFIIVIAIVKLLKLRFPQLNILFLDEISSSVDADGVYGILKILNAVIKENNLNTFVINHTVLPQEIFDKKIEIYKDNGFSKFTVETIN